MSALRIVLGDQLSFDMAALADLDAARDTFLMMEVTEETTYVRHHKQKIVLVLSAMRHFTDALRRRGVTVDYVELEGAARPIEPGQSSGRVKRVPFPIVRRVDGSIRRREATLRPSKLGRCNRLVDESERRVQASRDRSNSLTSGHRACQGCGEALGARYAIDAAMSATDGKVIAVNATGCLEVFTTPYPETSWQIPWMHSLFGNAAAVATGVAAAMRVLGRSETRVVAQGGDGGTTDIGFGCLSGMFERNDDVLYICYDNEGYMNTGVQRSSATPPAARTATTPAVGREPGNVFGTGKFAPKIAVAHEIPYVATASVADLHDLEAKVLKAMTFRGARYIQINVPCPLGWGAASHDTIKLARLAIETGLFPIFEAENGYVTQVRKIRRPAPVIEYLKLQRRFAHIVREGAEDPRVTALQALADRHIRDYGLLEAAS